MSVIQGSAIESSGGYQIANSVRFRSSASAYFSRTFGTPTDSKKWTWSGWVKRGTLGVNGALFSAGPGASDFVYADLSNSDKARIQIAIGSSTVVNLQTTDLVRDPSAHYHVMYVLDTTQAVQADRVKIYINGQQITSFSTSTNTIALNAATQANAASVVHTSGKSSLGASDYLDGYLSEIYFIDGQALTPSSFGQQDANSVWVPKAYTGTYGNNGFYLKFNDGTSATTLGYDRSGNGNNWTASGISTTAGVTYDWMTDTPTNNYATLNPIYPSAANISYAALRSGTTAVRGTVDALAVAGYWEVTAGASAPTCGVIADSGTTNTTTVTANKTFGFRLSAAGALDYINITDAGAWTSITTGLTGNQYPYGITQAADWNFGQRPFTYTPPTGFKALCTANLTSDTITTSGTFTGNASADGPFVWLNGNPASMTINGNAVTFGTHADKTAGGFKVRTNSASYNASGSNTYAITSTGKSFRRPNTAQGNP